ncbi:MAG: ribonuclease HII [Peptoniphilaceae bacterium]|nr:ribonuclease HII [Peptoniphilaceae bacterium]MDY6085559.1 ribonuclease HII [Peptoniphilaceae bacterium]
MKKDTWTPEQLTALQKRIDETPLVCGVDEVGRGPLAGPVVACAIIMPHGERIAGVRDSKKLSERKRERLYDEILEAAIAWGIGQCNAETIDRINIREATLLAMREAVLTLKDKSGRAVTPDLVIVDAETIPVDLPQVAVIKGDDRVYQVSCASIVAKVTRDRQMVSWDAKYPEYGFARHKGYGTAQHYEALRAHGVSPIHRLSFIHGEDGKHAKAPHSGASGRRKG